MGGGLTSDDCTVLAVNTGSSSLKASLFAGDGSRRDMQYRFKAVDSMQDIRDVFERLFSDVADTTPSIVAHRFVHGEDAPEPARLLDDSEIDRLQSIIHLAPLHLPGNLLGASLCQRRYGVPQIACFDTAFHHSMPELARRLPIPQDERIRRYGFHGLSYAYIASRLPALIGQQAYGRVVMAHLGSGASLCLTVNLKSVDTTMGYTPAGGICMATRSGDMDPGVMLELSRHYDADALSTMVNDKMGLIALSAGESSSMQELLSSPSPQAGFAVDYFCRQVTAAIGSLAAKAGGIDALVFSGGIGQHAPEVRAKICQPLEFMGIRLDSNANRSGNERLDDGSGVPVLCIATDEEFAMSELAKTGNWKTE